MAFVKDIKHTLLYGLILAILVFALKWLQWKFLIVDNAIDIYIGLIAVFFTALGVWVATQLVKPKEHTVIALGASVGMMHPVSASWRKPLGCFSKFSDLEDREYENRIPQHN